MVVYVVSAMVDDEYGCQEASRVFSSMELAQAYVDAHQEFVSVWWQDEDVPYLSIEEFVVDAE